MVTRTSRLHLFGLIFEMFAVEEVERSASQDVLTWVVVDSVLGRSQI